MRGYALGMVHVRHSYTIAELVELKGVSRSTIVTAIEAGHLKTEQTAGQTQRLITKTSADKWKPTPGKPGRKKA